VTVLMTADAVGGVWSYAVGLCRSLPGTGFVLATMGPRPRQEQRDEVDRLRNVTLVESDYGLEWMASGAVDLAESSAWLIGLVESYRIDIVHVNGYAHGAIGLRRPVLVVAHSDVLSWWDAVHKQTAPPEWDDYRRRVATGLAMATRVVAPTAAVLRELERHYVPLAAKAEVIANGIDFVACPGLPKRPVVLAAGRLWDAAKNFAALDEIAPSLAWPVEVAGGLQHPEGGIPKFSNVRLLGPLNSAQIAERLGGASIFAAPAWYEPFGLTILQAAAAGCALVLGDICSLRENWDGAAIFVPPQDRVALAAAINRVIADVQERARLAAAAQRRARNFTSQRMARAYAALYGDMARGSTSLRSA
jgi:glycogen synthase